MVKRFAAALAVPLAVVCGCAASPLGQVPERAVLLVANPDGLECSVGVVVGDECRLLTLIGTAATTRLEVQPGAYVVRAQTANDTVSLPAPLFDGVLPADRTLLVTVGRPPKAAAGFAFVPAGPALVGDTLGVGQEDERPARLVFVPAFWLARHECTNAEYAAFLNAVEPAVDDGWCAFDSRKCLVARDAATGCWTTTQPELSIVTVSLAGARAYCDWQTKVTGRRHRLPSEVEWEKAARGPESFVFAYGNVYRRDAANQESGALQSVGRWPPNGYGICDLTGNAFEWTSDAYRREPGRDSPPRADAQVLRGGSFVLDGMYLRNSFRMWQRPDVRTDDIGFRVAVDADA